MGKAIKLLTAFVMCFALVPAITGCASNVKTTGDSGQTQSDTVSFTDSAGRTVEIPTQIDRVVGTGPLAQQVLLTFEPDKLVGLSNKLSSDQAKYLGSEYGNLPVFGQLYGGDLNKEALASADPQLIIDIGEPKAGNVDDLNNLQDELGVPVIYISATLSDFASCYTTLGQILGNTDRGTELSDYCTKTYQSITDGMQQVTQKKTVLYCLGDNGTNVLGKGSFHAEALELIADNVAQIDGVSSKGSGNEVSLEQIALWNPDVIVFAPDSIYDSVSTADVWSGMSAIQNGTYCEVPDMPYNWMGSPPSINRYLGMQWFANLCYPDVFDYDMYDVAKEYYKTFYNYDLSQSDYDQIAANAEFKTASQAAA